MNEIQSVKSLVHSIMQADPLALKEGRDCLPSGASTSDNPSLANFLSENTLFETSLSSSTLSEDSVDYDGTPFDMKPDQLPAYLVLQSADAEADAKLSSIDCKVTSHAAFARLQLASTGGSNSLLESAFAEVCNLIRRLLDCALGEELAEDAGKTGFFMVKHTIKQKACCRRLALRL